MKVRIFFLLFTVFMMQQTTAAANNAESVTGTIYMSNKVITADDAGAAAASQKTALPEDRQAVALLSVVMPSTVSFVVDTNETNWNKVQSPDIYVQSLTDATLEVSIDSAVITTAGVRFMTDERSDVKAVRLAVAPKASYSSWNAVRRYALNGEELENYPINLTQSLSSYGTAAYKLYGSVSSGFIHNEMFSIKTVFKISIV